MNALLVQPGPKVQDHDPNCAMAFRTILGSPFGRTSLNHGGELLWTLDSVAPEHACEQNAEDQVDVFVCVPHWQDNSMCTFQNGLRPPSAPKTVRPMSSSLAR